MTPDMFNANVPAIRPGKLRASELNESDAIIVDGECRFYVTRRAVEPFAILADGRTVPAPNNCPARLA